MNNMRRTSGRWRRRTVGMALLFCFGCAKSPPPAPPELTGDTGFLEVKIVGFSNDEGQALVNVFRGPAGFPNDPEHAIRSESVPIEGGEVKLRFEEVPSGPIAVAVVHDEDSDFELDTGLFGIPAEKWGVSRDASGFLAPPEYDDAVLELAPGQVLDVMIQLGG